MTKRLSFAIIAALGYTTSMPIQQDKAKRSIKTRYVAYVRRRLGNREVKPWVLSFQAWQMRLRGIVLITVAGGVFFLAATVDQVLWTRCLLGVSGAFLIVLGVLALIISTWKIPEPSEGDELAEKSDTLM